MSLNLMPYLNASSSAKDLYQIDLCYLENSSHNPPSITFIEQGEKPILDPEPLGMTGSELVKVSFGNLFKIDIPIDFDDSPNDNLLALINSEFAAEKILDKEFLNLAAQKLKADTIKVAIPVRGSILICDSTDAEALKKLNIQLHRLYNDFSREPLSNLIFKIKDGDIISAETLEIPTSKLNEINENYGSYKEECTKAKLFQDLYNLRLVVEAEMIEDLQNGMFYSVLNLIKKHQSDRNFNRSIEVILGGDGIEKNKDNEGKIHYLLDKILEKIKSQNISIKESIKISFIFTVDFRNGDNHNKIIKHIK